LQQSERLKTPSDAQKHGLAHNDVGNSSSRKRHRDAKKGRSGGSVSTESSSRKTTSIELSSSGIESSVPKKKKRKNSQSSLTEEFKKAKPPTFDGEIKKGEEVKAWLFGLKKYFQVHNYSENTKARISIFNLNGGASIWWEDLKEIKGLKERKLTWKHSLRNTFERLTYQKSITMTKSRNSMSISWDNLPWMHMPKGLWSC
jgi:hypothetical protein